MQHSSSAFAPRVLQRWSQRQNLLPGLALVALAAAGWIYVAYQSRAMGSMGSMAMDGTGGGVVFLSGWTAMMIAVMVPATLPLILLYRTIARNRLSPAQSRVGMVVLLTGYLVVWAAAGIPVYAYSLFAEAASSLAAVLPALLLVVGGVYQFTPLKKGRLPRALQQPAVLPVAELASGSDWGAAARSGARARLSGLLCGVDGGPRGARDDELGLDANGGGYHLRGEDDP